MVTPGRLELPTNSLGNCCSIHLSYGATFITALTGSVYRMAGDDFACLGYSGSKNIPKKELGAQAFEAEERRHHSIDVFEAVVEGQRGTDRGLKAEPA